MEVEWGSFTVLLQDKQRGDRRTLQKQVILALLDLR